MKKWRGRTGPVGLPPGTLVYSGEKRVETARIRIMDYDEGALREATAGSPEECLAFLETPSVTWMNVVGLHDVKLIEGLGRAFDLHPLLLEDVLNTEQRPKLDDFESSVFLILRTLHYDEATSEISSEQISLVLGPDYLMTFQEIEEDPFEPIRERLRASKGRIRKLGPDYLAYALIDAIVDHYFVVLEKIGDGIEELGEAAVNDPSPETLHTIQTLKRELSYMRRSIWPLREVVSAFQRDGSALVQESTGVYLRDVYDHTIQVVETIEAFRDMVSGMFDTYLSSVSNRMNEVMKVLTIIATIFIPVTFIAGIYGMNFRNMPELEWPWAYYGTLGLMAVVCVVMILYFRKKRWL